MRFLSGSIESVRVFYTMEDFFNSAPCTEFKCSFNSFKKQFPQAHWECGTCSKPLFSPLPREGELVFDVCTADKELFDPSKTFCSEECAKSYMISHSSEFSESEAEKEKRVKNQEEETEQ